MTKREGNPTDCIKEIVEDYFYMAGLRFSSGIRKRRNKITIAEWSAGRSIWDIRFQ